ncbi:Xaa-Pro dipeptidase [Occallatibacter riparius]|uniref:Amidohydrolase family protein n=1 Tax=Occallatibacter riparius TaxID=1002689 RepID=A0A9J7BJA8_9BACT|nr:amidohydrolase family protein [Occallatibacter riparius]UWZ82553.1 amidohydrolase family protein [Occallatibacter riparius]
MPHSSSVFLRAAAAVCALAALPLTTHSQAKTPAPVPTTYVKAGHLFDATSDKLRDNVVLVIDGERISKIAPAAEVTIPADAKVLDLSSAWVLPGLIDCHTHLEARSDKYDPINEVKQTPFTNGFNGVVNAAKTLQAGFTSVRDVGSSPFFAVDLRRYIDEGFIPGPRVVASGPALSITGGHGDMNGFAPAVSNMLYPAEKDFAIVDSPDEIRHAIRAQVKYGVDVIKILATGGVLSQGDKPGAEQFTYEEMKTAVETAHATGRKVAAHAHGTQGIKDAVRAGVDSIEHGSLIDAEGIQLMKQHGTYLVADIYNDDYILGKAVEFGLPQENVDKEKMVGRLQRENFQKAVEAGVKIAFGTDAGVYPHGDNAKQFHYMVKFGMTPAGAIRAATQSAADLIDRSKDIGTLESGKYADLIAVTANPLDKVEVLEHVGFVMKGGKVYKDELSPAK